MGTSDESQRLFFQTEVFESGRGRRERRAPLGMLQEPSREIPIHDRCDVLVAGGGPAGTAAALAAARLGARVILAERYNHLGGLSTGGLVIWIDRMTDWDGKQVIAGIANDLLDRLPKEAVAGPPPDAWGSRDAATAAYWKERTAAFHGITTWSPTVDPEHLKSASQTLLLEAGVTLLYHAWVAAPIVEDDTMRGAIFESKEGRRAVLADVVVDATGDGDLYARAGAAFATDINGSDIHHCMNTSFLLGGVDMERWIAFKAGSPDAFADFMARGRAAMQYFERPFVSWRNDIALFMGPRHSGFSALAVDDLTAVEIMSRDLAMKHCTFFRAHAPGFDHAYLVEMAPQLGVRHSRRLKGVRPVLRSQWPEGTVLDDEIGISPALSPKFPNISVPYGALVPERLDGLLAPGRHIASDASSHSFLREIPQCWLTGQAAGVAAALAAARKCAPRDVPVGEVQQALRAQGAIVRSTAATEAAASSLEKHMSNA